MLNEEQLAAIEARDHISRHNDESNAVWLERVYCAARAHELMLLAEVKQLRSVNAVLLSELEEWRESISLEREALLHVQRLEAERADLLAALRTARSVMPHGRPEVDMSGSIGHAARDQVDAALARYPVPPG